MVFPKEPAETIVPYKATQKLQNITFSHGGHQLKGKGKQSSTCEREMARSWERKKPKN
jgi:hypothetical protein